MSCDITKIADDGKDYSISLPPNATFTVYCVSYAAKTHKTIESGLCHEEAKKMKQKLNDECPDKRFGGPVYCMKREMKDGDLAEIEYYRIVGPYHLTIRREWQETFTGIVKGHLSRIADTRIDQDPHLWTDRSNRAVQFDGLLSAQDVETFLSNEQRIAQVQSEADLPVEWRQAKQMAESQPCTL